MWKFNSSRGCDDPWSNGSSPIFGIGRSRFESWRVSDEMCYPIASFTTSTERSLKCDSAANMSLNAICCLQVSVAEWFSYRLLSDRRGFDSCRIHAQPAPMGYWLALWFFTPADRVRSSVGVRRTGVVVISSGSQPEDGRFDPDVRYVMATSTTGSAMPC